MKTSPAPSAPSPPMMIAKGLVTAAVAVGSEIGIAGLPMPLKGTFTAIVPFGPGVKVSVALLNVVSWLAFGSNSPQLAEVVAASTSTSVAYLLPLLDFQETK